MGEQIIAETQRRETRQQRNTKGKRDNKKERWCVERGGSWGERRATDMGDRDR